MKSGSGSSSLSLSLAILLVAAPPAVEASIAAILEGPISRARRVEVRATDAIIGLEVAAHVALEDLPPEIENRFETVVGLLAAQRPDVDAIHLLVAHPGEPLAPPPSAPSNPDRRVFAVRSDPSRFPFGQALAGRVVAISAGHGYIYYDTLNGYSTQRGNTKWNGCGSCRGIVEDFETHEIVVRYLVPLLEGAGARVIMVRDRSYADGGAIVDDGDATYRETGAFSDGTSEGGHGADYRVADATDAAATFTLVAPASGPQHLSFWFVSGANRYDAARLFVEVEGVRRDYVLDLVTHGRRWAPITDLIVEAGASIDVTLAAPETPVADRFLVADAVRLGSGRHASNHPWWQMGAKPFAEYQGAPASIQTSGDVTIRPRYAEFYGADIYVALHSNASGQPDSTAAGTATYRYNCGAFPDHSNDPPATDCDDPNGSDRLQALVHQHLVEALRADWDPNWRDRGTKVANFGEMRDLDQIPGILIESAFHDNVVLAGGSDLRMTDNQALHDPRWRRSAAYGIYRGISEFFAAGGPLLAPPPADVALRRVDRTTVEVTFTPSAEATAHRVYVAIGSRVFDHGRIVMGESARIEDLPEDAVVSVRVAALNAAGEGRASHVVAARPSARPAQLLLVDAFEREDAWVQEVDNRHDTLFAYALALQSVAHAFDGATEAALVSGAIDLGAYDGIVVALGRESTADGILTPQLRDRVRTSSVAVFLAGSEIAWALDERGDDESRAFLTDLFGARYAADDAGSATIEGRGGWLASTPVAALADTPGDAMQAFSSDVLAVEPGAVAELVYDDGARVAAVRRGANLAMGVALDSVVDPQHRAAILGAWATNAVELAPVTPVRDGGVGVDAGRDGGDGRDAGTPPDGGPADAGGPEIPGYGVRPGSDAPITGGCGCDAVPARPSGGLGLLLLALALRGIRRSSQDPIRRSSR